MRVAAVPNSKTQNADQEKVQSLIHAAEGSPTAVATKSSKSRSKEAADPGVLHDWVGGDKIEKADENPKLKTAQAPAKNKGPTRQEKSRRAAVYGRAQLLAKKGASGRMQRPPELVPIPECCLNAT